MGMKVLGLCAMGPNTASCIVVDGNIVAFAEEERFTRVKLATNTIPVRSSKYCLSEANLNLSDIDEIAYKREGFEGKFPKIIYYNHHLCHAYSVFYPSPFDEAIIVVADGSGEEIGTSVWIGRGNKISMQYKYNLPDSIGFFYAALTEYLGFSVFTGEGKVMGLAPYGKENLEIRKKLDKVLKMTQNGYKIDPEYIYFSKRSYSLRHTDKLVSLLGQLPRKAESNLTPFYCDVAYETQYKLEQLIEFIVENAVKKFGIKNLCLTGGVANNCKMNGFISSL